MKFLALIIIIILLVVVGAQSCAIITFEDFDPSYFVNASTMHKIDDSIDFSEYLAYLVTFGNGDFTSMASDDLNHYLTLLNNNKAKKFDKYDSYYNESYEKTYDDYLEILESALEDTYGIYERRYYELELTKYRKYQHLTDKITGELRYYSDGTKICSWVIAEKMTKVEKWKEEEGTLLWFPIPEDYTYTNYDDWGTSRTYGGNRKHEGNDIIGVLGTPIINMSDGYIDSFGWNDLGGWYIAIRNNNKMFYYAHLDSYAKEFVKGEFIEGGKVIAFMGDSGYGPEGTYGKFPVHLHLQIRVDYSDDNIWIDPYSWLTWSKTNMAQIEYLNGEWITVNDIK